MLCGGTLAILAQLGLEVHVVCAPRGEGGELGNPPVCSREDIGVVRSHELTCAVNALGAASLTFLNYIDPLVGENETLFAFTQDEDLLVEELLREIHRTGASILLTHGSNGEYGHPAHVLIYRAAQAAARRIGPDRLAWYTVQAAYPQHPRPLLMNQDDPADLILDVSSVIERKIHAVGCHRSQHDLFLRRTAELIGRPASLADTALLEESLNAAGRDGSQIAPDHLLELLSRFSRPYQE